MWLDAGPGPCCIPDVALTQHCWSLHRNRVTGRPRSNTILHGPNSFYDPSLTAGLWAQHLSVTTTALYQAAYSCLSFQKCCISNKVHNANSILHDHLHDLLVIASVVALFSLSTLYTSLVKYVITFSSTILI
jgi:hypothetical protein